MSLINAWIADLRETLESSSLDVREVRVGVFYTAVQIFTGHVGVAFTPRGLTDTVCCPKTAASGLPAGSIAGRDAWEVANYALSPSSLRRAAGVATLNALSALAMERHGVPGAKVKPGLDALDAAEVSGQDRVAMVGAFVPFIKRLRGQVVDLKVVDQHPEALKPDEIEFWCSPAQAEQTLLRASVVIISGSALVEAELDGLLRASSRARMTVLAGPTASPWPPTFFAHGVDVLGGIHVRDAARLLAVVGEGGSGYLFGDAAEKVSIVKNGTPRM